MKLYCCILILLQFLNLFQSYKKDGIYVTEGTSETICILGDTLLYSNGFDPVHPELPTVCKMVKAPGQSRNAYLVYTYSPLNWPIHYKMNKEYNKDEMDPPIYNHSFFHLIKSVHKIFLEGSMEVWKERWLHNFFLLR